MALRDMQTDKTGRRGGREGPGHPRTPPRHAPAAFPSQPHHGFPPPSLSLPVSPSLPPCLTYIVERDGSGRIERGLDGQDHLLGGDRRGQEGHEECVGVHGCVWVCVQVDGRGDWVSGCVEDQARGQGKGRESREGIVHAHKSCVCVCVCVCA